ncbi:hypothetical protein ACH5RR_027910 [Cinchona calisaya]|uniref:Uncharacterized protein n=1 Tax=Cinchona calisaya TaxID=153742 RepID=A0ABD2YR45_9GENT
MVQRLEAIRGGGGSIKVGTTGTIGALMSRELESIKPELQKPATFGNMSLTDCNLLPAGASTRKTFKSKRLVNEASSSSNRANYISPEIIRKTKHYSRKSQIPMLDSDNISVDGTPIRQKSDKRLSYRTEYVDIKCGSPDRAWASPITNRLKKLGFSKLSESIII